MEYVLQALQKAREKRHTAILAVCMAGMCFFMTRAQFFDVGFPAAAALLCVLMKRTRRNLAFLPVPLLSLYLLLPRGYPVFGDAAACALVCLCLLLPLIKRLNTGSLCLLTGAATAACHAGYYALADMTYRLQPRELLLSAAAAAGLCFAYDLFLQVYFAERETTADAAVISLLAVLLTTVCGLSLTLEPFLDAASDHSLSFLPWPALLQNGSAAFGGFGWSLPLTAALFLVLTVGWRQGIPVGAAAGAASGAVLLAAGDCGAGHIAVLAIGGMVAGFYRDENRIVTAVCFAAACLLLGMAKGYPSMSMPVLQPLVAASLFAVMKRSWLLLPKTVLLQTEKQAPQESAPTAQITELLQNCSASFRELSEMYSRKRDLRSTLACQFSGLTEISERMLSEIDAPQCRSFRESRYRAYNIRSGFSGYARGASVSGDSFLCGDIDKTRYMIALSDGMGKGEAAASESRLAVNTLVKLAQAGFSAENALRTVHAIMLLNRSEEIFTTVDMGILDRGTGRLKLLKAGAATTFIRSKAGVSSIKSSCLPVGLIEGIQIDYINTRLTPGDILIMVSDGVIDSVREDPAGAWLGQAIGAIKSEDPQTIADLLINRAVENYGVREKDDMTVLAFKLE